MKSIVINNLVRSRDRVLFLLVIPLAYMLASHGGAGYVSSRYLAVTGYLVFAFLIMYWIANKGFKVTKFYFLMVVIFSALILFSMFVPVILGILEYQSSTGLTFIILNLLILLFFLTLVFYYQKNSIDNMALSFVFVAFFSLIVAIYLITNTVEVFGITFGREGYYRLLGSFSTPNRFGEVVAVGAIASLYLFSTKNKMIYAIFSAVFVLATLLSGSRGVIIGLLPAMCIYVLYMKLWKNKKFIKAFILIIYLLVITVFLFIEQIYKAIKFDRYNQIADMASPRLEIWDIGINSFMSKPLINQLFGSGVRSFVSDIGKDPHSMYMNLIYEFGIISFLFIAIILLYVLYKIVNANKENKFQYAFAITLIVFCFIRGFTMPTIFIGLNFATIAFYAGLSVLTMYNKRGVSKK